MSRTAPKIVKGLLFLIFMVLAIYLSHLVKRIKA